MLVRGLPSCSNQWGNVGNMHTSLNYAPNSHVSKVYFEQSSPHQTKMIPNRTFPSSHNSATAPRSFSGPSHAWLKACTSGDCCVCVNTMAKAKAFEQYLDVSVRLLRCFVQRTLLCYTGCAHRNPGYWSACARIINAWRLWLEREESKFFIIK